MTGFLSTLWARRYRFADIGRGVSVEWGLRVQAAESVRIGRGFACGRNCTIVGPVTIGHRVKVNSNVHISAGPAGEIQIGDFVMIGPNVVIRAANHGFERDILIQSQGHIGLAIAIGDDVWIGANAIILPGVTIAPHCVVGAGSVVTKEFLVPWSIIAGNPAVKIGERK